MCRVSVFSSTAVVGQIALQQFLLLDDATAALNQEEQDSNALEVRGPASRSRHSSRLGATMYPSNGTTADRSQGFREIMTDRSVMRACRRALAETVARGSNSAKSSGFQESSQLFRPAAMTVPDER